MKQGTMYLYLSQKMKEYDELKAAAIVGSAEWREYADKGNALGNALIYCIDNGGMPRMGLLHHKSNER
jgi:L-2-hydroxyglutarate oxidase LhgO